MRRDRKEERAIETFWLEAMAFVKKSSPDPRNQLWFDLNQDTPRQLEAWSRYFLDRLGFLPAGVAMMTQGKIPVFLAPAEWPEWFDSKAGRAA